MGGDGKRPCAHTRKKVKGGGEITQQISLANQLGQLWFQKNANHTAYSTEIDRHTQNKKSGPRQTNMQKVLHCLAQPKNCPRKKKGTNPRRECSDITRNPPDSLGEILLCTLIWNVICYLR